MNRTTALIWLVVAPSAGVAHHSLIGYDEGRLIEVEGEVASVFWHNPHVRLTIDSTAGNGRQETWTLESGSRNYMERRGIGADSIAIGDRLHVLGLPSKLEDKSVWPVQITWPDGRQLAVVQDLARNFGLAQGNAPATAPAVSDEDVEGAIRSASGIFRVWTNRGWIDDARQWIARAHPLANHARIAFESWDQPTDDLALRCIPAGMPEAMLNPFPIEFTEQHGDIVLHIEEWDNVRTIHMDAGSIGSDAAPGPLGYSVGRWEGNTLVVNTNRIDYPYLDDRGTPQSEAVEIVERFTLGEDETRLDWSATVFDPETFTEPIAMPELHWEWVPGEQLRTFNCTVPDN